MPRQARLNRSARRGATPLAVALLLGTIVGTGCGLSGAGGTAPAVAPVPAAPPLPATEAVPMTPQALRTGRVEPAPGATVTADALAADVRADAARLLGRADGASLAVRVEAVTWSDGALGCPQPGLMYTQALVPGWRVVVGDGARELRYHASRSGHWVQCPAGLARDPLPAAATR